MKPDYEAAVTNSALWAAAGDALGWITELAREGTVKARAGIERVTRPTEWRRLIGGRAGVRVVLPAGTYSDDTQLRLSVCRAIRGNGVFDAEAFARIELTTWQAYALGAGNGTRTAATNLSKRGVNWFSNFFETKTQSYVNAGGNGAAMRIQPHVWVARSEDGALLPVLRDALSSHGHTHGFCGAAFHAAALAEILHTKVIGGLDSWRKHALTLQSIPLAIGEDRQLEEFWRPAWEHKTKRTVQSAVGDAMEELLRDIDLIQELVERDDPTEYGNILDRLGCLSDRYRGSGLKTALAASILAWLHRSRSPESALVESANVLASDTDTIGTMAGALLGAASKVAPNWPIQDREYIEFEARRLSLISQGHSQDEFAYPDLAKWQAPQTQSDAVGRFGSDLAVVGLGVAHPFGKEYVSEDSVWQWLSLSFGQTVLAKRRKAIRRQVSIDLLPSGRREGRRLADIPTDNREPGLPFVPQNGDALGRRDVSGHRMAYTTNNRNQQSGPTQHIDMLDFWTDEVIRSNFDDRVLGQFLNRCIDEYGTIEGAVTFAGIVAKAKIARQRRAKSTGSV